MKTIFPLKLKKGDEVRIIAPASSFAISGISDEQKKIAEERLVSLGLTVNYGKHINELDAFDSSSIESRIADIHDAFRDPTVKLVLATKGGFNSNQLLRYLDYDLIRNNPKALCGFSDITALANAIYAKTGLVTYSAPNFFTFGEKHGFDYSLEYFQKCLFSDELFEIKSSTQWSDDQWADNQEQRTFIPNEGHWVINEGAAEGTIIGGNQCTLNLLQGTEFMPDLKESILFLEDDYEAHNKTIDRDLQSLIHLPSFVGVRGIVFGRFQIKTGMTKELLTKIVKTKKELGSLPIIANVDFGHTTPKITFPIGGAVRLTVSGSKSSIVISRH